ncbi:hypothetical protein BC332_01617 [Capsicum chinense]|nr:hypothetical protein BC332_01617 [Capsicum chinense]
MSQASQSSNSKKTLICHCGNTAVLRMSHTDSNSGHKFYNCAIAKVRSIWETLLGWLGITRRMGSWQEEVQWLSSLLKGSKPKPSIAESLLAATVYQPDPPDPMMLDSSQHPTLASQQKLSYINALSQTVPSSNDTKQETTPSPDHIVDDMGNTDKVMDNDMECADDQHSDSIVLSKEDAIRIHKPWSYSVIIKLTKIKISYEYLRHNSNSSGSPVKI